MRNAGPGPRVKIGEEEAQKIDEPLNMAQILAMQSSSRLPIKDKLDLINDNIKSSESKTKPPLQPYVFTENEKEQN